MFREGQVCGLKTGVQFGDSCESAVLTGALHSPRWSQNGRKCSLLEASAWLTSEPWPALFPQIGGDESQNPSPFSLTTAPPTPVPLLMSSLSFPLLPASCLHFSPLGSLILLGREATTAALGGWRGLPLPPQALCLCHSPFRWPLSPLAQKQPKCPPQDS